MTVRVTIEMNGARVPVELDEEALRAIAAALPAPTPERESEFLTIPEAALLLGCGYKPCPNCGGDDCRRCRGIGEVVNRQRVDDLLSARRLPRYKDGGRTLLRRADLLAYLEQREERR